MTVPFDPSARSGANTLMADRLWELRTVYGGTELMKAAGLKLLPKFEREDTPDWQARLAQARLRRNMFRQSVDRITGRIFEVPTMLTDAEEGSAAWDFKDDVDRMGNSLSRFARNMFLGALKLGMMHLFVDYPKVVAANLAQERAQKPRPYFIMIQPEDLLEGYEDAATGQVTYLRWRVDSTGWDEAASAPVVTSRIHERFPGRARVWKQITTARPAVPGTTLDANSNWELEEEYAVSQKRIMLHTLYAEREGFLIARTPLTEVKDLTIEHWQLASDYRTCLQHVLFPILYATGIAKDEAGNMKIGPKTVLGSTSKDAKFGYVEHTGAAIKVGADDLLALEQRAEAYAGQLTAPSGDVKATQSAISSAEVSSFAKDMADALEDMLQAAVDDACLWQPAMGTPRVVVNKDFAVDLPDGDLTELGSMRRAGDLPLREYWTEMMRRNVLRRDFNMDEAEAEVEGEMNDAMARETAAMESAAKITAENAPPPKPPAGA